MLTIRLARVGKKNRAQFKIMLQEHTVAPGGRHIEILGSHDPHLKQTVFKEERIKYWLSKGAQASDTVHNLLVSKGLIEDKKRPVKLPKKAEEKKEEEAAENASEAALKTEEKTAEEAATGEKPAEAEEKKEEPVAEPVKEEKKEEKTEEAPKKE